MTTLRTRSCFLAVLAAILLAGGPLAGETAFLVDDLAPFATSNGGSHPDFRFRIGNRAAFIASDLRPGLGLWTTDGTAAGTELLPIPPFELTPRGTLRGRTILVGPRPEGPIPGGLALWLSDGTAAGTERVALRGDVLRATADRNLGDSFFFFTEDPATKTSTLRVLAGDAVAPLPVAALGARTVSEALVAGDRLFFLASEAFLPLECPIPRLCAAPIAWKLWVSDGTARGTRPVGDAGSAPSLVRPAALHRATAAGIYFSVTDLAAPHTRLFFSRGTSGAPRLLAEYRTVNALGQMPRFAVDGDRVLFIAQGLQAGTELWESRGTAASTRRVTDFPAEAPFFGGLRPDQLAVIDGTILLPAFDEEHGYELWATDGLPESTRRLTDFCPGPCNSVDFFSNLVVSGGRVLLALRKATGKGALWHSDGTAAGTGLRFDPGATLADDVSLNLVAGDGTVFFAASTAATGAEVYALRPADLAPRALTAFSHAEAVGPVLSGLLLGGRLLFAAADEQHGVEPWSASVNPNPATARLISDLVVGNGPSSNPVGLTRLGERVLFFACHEGHVGLFATSGHPGSTRRLQTLATNCLQFTTEPPNNAPPPLVVRGNLAVHRADPNGQIWRTDGTPEGTFALTSPSSNLLFGPVLVGDRILFLRQTGVQGTGSLAYEVWESDGTLTGTVLKTMLRNIGLVHEIHGAQDRFYFTGSSAGFNALSASDGTQEGTFLLIRSQPRSSARNSFTRLAGFHFVHLGGFDYFAWQGELWRSNGTPATTESVDRFFTGPRPTLPVALTVWNDALYLFTTAESFSSPLGFWRTDGTVEGTEKLAELPGANLFTIGPPVAFGDRLAFLAATTEEGETVRRLWFSDGTAAGTGPLDLDLGDPDAASCELAAWNGALYFAAGPELGDLELWRSDGSVAGTRLVQEIAPGASLLVSGPANLMPLPDRLLFAANDGFFGREVWALPAGGQWCQPSSTRLCLRGQRFQAEVQFQDPTGRSFAGEAAELTAEAGAFSFFRAGNLDLFLKVLDGSAVNGRGWVFVGALSDASFTLTLTDTVTGAARRYTNPSGRLTSFADTSAFDLRGALLAGEVEIPEARGVAGRRLTRDKVTAGACAPAAERLCLLGGRYAVEIDWRTEAASGRATLRAESDTSGTFWFFRPDNLEGALKMIDGTAVNGHAWFFFTGLTNVELTIRVRDTTTGALRTYTKPRGTFTAFADVGAL